jgi:uncharacterized protein (UPF0333 family)
MRLAARLNASFIVAVLIASLCFTSFSSFASAQSTILPVTGEYAEGTLSTNHPFNIWYDWINTSNTQVIYYAAYTPSDYPFPVPVANLIGQHMQLSDGTEVFVASCLDGMEKSTRQNGNGIPAANFTTKQIRNPLLMYTPK